MSRYCLSLLLSLFAQVLLAQGSVDLRGWVLDGDTNEPVEFATVSLLNATDSTLLGVAVAGVMGVWKLPGVKRGASLRRRPQRQLPHREMGRRLWRRLPAG